MNEHCLIRATIIPEVIKLIAEHDGISLDEALERFYNSATAENLADEESGLYGQSALFIFGQYLEEMEYRASQPSDESAKADGEKKGVADNQHKRLPASALP